eukprot:symbB.v1.2.019188.t1/scaffold1561.1/size111715/4
MMPAIQDDREKDDVVENTLEMNEKTGSFTVQISLPEMYLRNMGLEFDDVDPRGPMIMSISNGVIQEFNKDNPAKALKPWDCITAVNGQSGNIKVVVDALKNAMLTSDKILHLTVARPTPYQVTLEKASLKLGAQLNYKPSSKGISLSQITSGGRFDKWNSLNPDQQIMVGDRIIAVADAELVGAEMLEALKSQDKDLALTILRY